MKPSKIFFRSVLIFFCSHSCAQSKNDSVFSSSYISSVKLTDAEKDKSVSLGVGSVTAEPRLFVFLSPECPLCQNYTLVLNKIYRDYLGKIKFYGIIPGKTYPVQTVSSFAQKYKIAFPLLIDNALTISHYLQASTTPEAILLNGKAELVYKGAIDDWIKDIGQQRTHATQNFLRDALDRELRGEAVIPKRTKAIGCFINDY
jgi:thiol-disulfide isomerase/thioredoxin